MIRVPLSRQAKRFARSCAYLGSLALLAGCAQHNSHFTSHYEATQYAAHARRSYPAPGPAADPWGPYIAEASAKYDVPDRWIRAVMRQESGGRLYEDGQLITSAAGAMGLMQVMPITYEELRQRYGLGDDPFDPHDNIMAGTAYIREMYDVYGAPGFLAAYNAGPKRLDDYLLHNRPLPDETRHYVASIGPNIAGTFPNHQSQAQQYATNQLPTDIPPGPRYPRNRSGGAAPVALASAAPRGGRASAGWSPGWKRGEIQVADLPVPPAPVSFDPPPKASRGFHLVPRAMADTLPVHTGGPVGGTWAIQVGAFSNQTQAYAAAEAAREQAHIQLASVRPVVGAVHQARSTLYRARLTGLSRDAAILACERLAKKSNCLVVSPGAQS